MNNAPNKKQSLPWWRCALLALVLLAMALLAALIFVDYLFEKQLGNVVIKISRASEPVTFLDLLTDPNTRITGEDAASYYVEAFTRIPLGDLEGLSKVNTFYRKSFLYLPANQFPAELNDKVTQNLSGLQSVMDKFDKAAQLPLYKFDVGVEQGMQVCKNSINCIQSAAVLLSLRTLHLVRHGDDDGAVSSAITSLKMTRVFDSCPIMVLHTAKALLLINSCQDIRLLLENTHPSDASLAKLQDALSQLMPPDALERMFYAERTYQLEIARNLLPEDIASRFLQEKVPTLPERLFLPSSRVGQIRIRQQSARYFKDMTKLVAAAKRPWPQPLDAAVSDTLIPDQKPEGLLAGGAVFINLTAETTAMVRCALLTVAIERYRRQYNNLPNVLSDLCPAFIDSVPIDPFTGKELLFTKTEDSYVVYSAGTNRKDDGGAIVRKPEDTRPLDSGLSIRLRKPE